MIRNLNPLPLISPIKSQYFKIRKEKNRRLLPIKINTYQRGQEKRKESMSHALTQSLFIPFFADVSFTWNILDWRGRFYLKTLRMEGKVLPETLQNGMVLLRMEGEGSTWTFLEWRRQILFRFYWKYSDNGGGRFLPETFLEDKAVLLETLLEWRGQVLPVTWLEVREVLFQTWGGGERFSL